MFREELVRRILKNDLTDEEVFMLLSKKDRHGKSRLEKYTKWDSGINSFSVRLTIFFTIYVPMAYISLSFIMLAMFKQNWLFFWGGIAPVGLYFYLKRFNKFRLLLRYYIRISSVLSILFYCFFAHIFYGLNFIKGFDEVFEVMNLSYKGKELGHFIPYIIKEWINELFKSIDLMTTGSYSFIVISIVVWWFIHRHAIKGDLEFHRTMLRLRL